MAERTYTQAEMDAVLAELADERARHHERIADSLSTHEVQALLRARGVA
jgi:hypothetical protein